MEKLCKNCKWWGRYSNGACDAPQSDITKVNKGCEGTEYQTIDKSGFYVLADADDDSGLIADLITGPEFGCVKFAEKD